MQLSRSSVCIVWIIFSFFFFQAEDGIRDAMVTGVQTCALPIWITFVERYDPSIPPVAGDDEKLIQVMLNLVRNAEDAVAGRADPCIALETSVASIRLRAASGRTRPLARIAVIDNGPGIPDPMLARLFTPFATTKPHGTSLGLAISRRLVQAHGGRIEVKNRTGGGAEAALYLPLDVP